jgi:hypothetical protein
MKYAQSSSAVVESNPFRIEVILKGLTWGSRIRDNPRLREVTPTGKTHSALLNQTSCGVWSGLSVERVFNLFNACHTAFRGTSTRSSVWAGGGQKMNSWQGRLADSALLTQTSCGVWLGLSAERVFNLFNACHTRFRSTSTSSSVWNASGQKMNSWKGRLAGSALLNQRSCRVFAVLAGAPTNLEVCRHGTDQMPLMGQENRALLNQRNSRRRGAGIWMTGPSGDRLKTRRTDGGRSLPRRGVGFQPAERVKRRGWLDWARLCSVAWGTDKPGGSSPRIGSETVDR